MMLFVLGFSLRMYRIGMVFKPKGLQLCGLSCFVIPSCCCCACSFVGSLFLGLGVYWWVMPGFVEGSAVRMPTVSESIRRFIGDPIEGLLGPLGGTIGAQCGA